MEGAGELTDLHCAEGHQTSLRFILLAVGEEFRELGHFAERFQLTLSPAVKRLALDAACHRDVQSLDLLSQRLAALSDYISEISQLLPAELNLNSHRALASIPLSDLRYRLMGAPAPINEAHRTGELEMF